MKSVLIAFFCLFPSLCFADLFYCEGPAPKGSNGLVLIRAKALSPTEVKNLDVLVNGQQLISPRSLTGIPEDYALIRFDLSEDLTLLLPANLGAEDVFEATLMASPTEKSDLSCWFEQ